MPRYDEESTGKVLHEILGSNQLLRVKRSRVGRHNIPIHRLPVHKISMVIRGEGVVLSSGERYPLRPGSLYFCEPFTPQAFPAGNERVEHYEVLFNAPVLLDTFPQWHEQAPGLWNYLKRRSAQPRPLFIPIRHEYRSLFLESFCALLKEDSAELPAQKPPLALQFARVLLILRDARRIAGKSGAISDTGHPGVDCVLNRLSCDYSQPLTLQGLADEVGWSGGYLTRAFKRHTGSTITETLNRMRVERAAHLLLATNQSVAEIAGACGFNEVPYFNRRFKRLLGLTPTAFRFRSS